MTDTTQSTVETVATIDVAKTDPAAVAAPETTTTEQPAEAAPEGEAEAEQPRDQNGRFAKRTEKLKSQIDTLVAQKRQAEREYLAMQAQAAELRKQLQTQPEIDPADFDAQTRHQMRSVLNEEKLSQTEAQARRAAEMAQAATGAILEAQVEELKEHIPDIEKIFAPPEQGGPVISRIMAEGISRAENGALVAHYLMKNPREAARINTLDPVSALVEVGLIAARIKPSNMKRVSQAPAPVPTVSGGSSSPVVDLSSVSFKDYAKMRLKQMEGG